MELRLPKEVAQTLNLMERYRVVLQPVDAETSEDIVIGERIISRLKLSDTSHGPVFSTRLRTEVDE